VDKIGLPAVLLKISKVNKIISKLTGIGINFIFS
jgi:hypothetical protein